MGLLHEAAERGDWMEIERLAEAGADVNEYDDEVTPILAAASNGHVEAIRTLLRFGADPDLTDESVGDPPVFYAAANRHGAAVLALLADRSSDRMADALVYSAAYGLVPVVDELLRLGVPPNDEDGTSDAISAAAGRSSRAYRDERLAIMRRLLPAGAKPNPEALQWASREKDREMVQLLVEHGLPLTLEAAAALGDIPSVQELLPSASKDVLTSAVVVSVDSGHTEALRELLAREADLKQAALHAITNERDDLLKMLLDAGLDPNERTPDTGTILFYAANRGRPEPVRMLIRAGADVNAKTWNGHTALFRAISGQRTEAVQILLDAGADPNVVIDGLGSLLTFAVGRNYTQIATLLRRAGGEMRGS
ncbi:hypothetical protein EON82_06955 [bacterium]|nr:MAG: hypothetical protein EON82_06955 [bacterium]